MKIKITASVAILGATMCSGCMANESGMFSEFEAYYGIFLMREMSLERTRSVEGDVEYLEQLSDDRSLFWYRRNYELYGNHPESSPPTETPDDASPPRKSLAAQRVFVAKYYFDLWAATLVLKRDAQAGDFAVNKVKLLVEIYEEDIDIQLLTKNIISKYSNNNQFVFEGVTGKEVARHMSESIESTQVKDSIHDGKLNSEEAEGDSDEDIAAKEDFTNRFSVLRIVESRLFRWIAGISMLIALAVVIRVRKVR